MSRKKVYLGLAAMGCVAVASQSALAANDAMQDLLKVLKEKGTIDAATYESLKGAAQADDEQNTAGQSEIKAAAKNLPKIETKGKLEWGTPDGEFNWRLGGRIHLDSAAYYDNDNGTTLTEGVDVRRARLELSATLWRNWMLKFDYDFGGTTEVKEGFRDMYLRYALNGPWPTTFTLGQFKEYFGLESLTSSNDTTFMERSMPSRLFHDFAEGSDGRRLGFGVATSLYDMGTVSLGVFGKNVSGDSKDDVADPLVFNGRLTFSPIHTDKTVVHLGFAGSWLDTQTSDRVSFAARPEARIGADKLVDTGVITGADETTRYGGEAAAVYGPFSVQGEYLHADVDRKGLGLSNVGFDGWYVLGSWVITGESRIYEFERGIFKNPKPYGIVGKGGWGAWELAARYSSVDLNDNDIQGGEQEDFTAGLNWYPTPNFKFMANYVKVLDIKGGDFDGAEPNAFEVRAQAYW